MKNNLKYKETNVSWIGKIPIDWSLRRAKYLFSRSKEINKDLKCKNLLSLTYGGVLNKDFYANEGLRPENYNTYQLFDKNDLVFKMIDLSNVKTSRVGIVHEYGIMSSAYIRFRPLQDKIYPKFAYWFFYDLYKKQVYNSIGSGVRSTLSSDDMSEFELPLPQIEEQKTISHFLNRKTSQIEMLISKIKKKIKFYNEKRVAIISEVLTVGLSKNIEKKNSGSDLIGKIPKHWDLWSIRHLINIDELDVQDGNHGEIHPKSEDYVEKGIPFVMASNLKNGKLDLENCNKLNKTQTDNLRIGFSYEGDVLLSHKGSIGKVALVEKLETDYIMLTPQVTYYRTKQKKVRRLFLYFVFQSRSFLDQMYLLSSDGSTRNFCGIVDQKNIFFPIPPLDEQKKIEAFLNDKIKKIDQILHKEKCRINLLNEYSESLISSVVTGKISLKKRKDAI